MILWIAFAVTSVLSIAVIAYLLRHPPTFSLQMEVKDVEDIDTKELLETACELYAIRQRLDVAWTRRQLSGEADRLRRELAAELRRIEVLEGQDRE